jgi:hypothetical protein
MPGLFAFADASGATDGRHGLETRGYNGHKPRPGRAALARRGFNTTGATRKQRIATGVAHASR